MSEVLAELLQQMLGASYRIERELTGGGMSRVFLATDIGLGRQVVVKVLPPDLACRTSVARFRREIDVMVQLHHPHVLPILTAGGTSDVLYYSMPYVAGESLRERIARQGPLSVDLVHRILSQIGEALDFAHRRGIVHRDVKPGNVLLLEDHAVLADFGIARALTSDSDILTTGTAPGTAAYLAPEHPQDQTADLFALSLVGAEMLTGTRHRAGTTAGALIAARLAGTEEDRRKVPRDERRARVVARALAQGLSVNPARRFSSAKALCAAMTGRTSFWPASRTATRLGIAGAATALLLATSYGVHSTSGARAYERALAEAEAWDVARARASARRALTIAPTNARAALLAARLAAYDEEDSLFEVGGAAARQALASRDGLDAGEILLAEALLALFERRFADACGSYLRLAAVRSRNFDAWFGLGECRRRDTAVIPDDRSPSGFAFRSSYHAAASAYEQAIQALGTSGRVPPFPFRRLSRVLYTERNRLRTGMLERERTAFRAYAQLSDDTLAFVPFKLAGPHAERLAVPPTRAAAIEADMFRLRRAFAGWTRTASDDAEAHQAFSELLEVMGDIGETGAEEASALSEIRRARRFARDTSVVLVAVEVRQLLKNGEFSQARALADSALERWPTPPVSEAPWVVSLAALTGRLSMTAKILGELSASPRYAPRVRGAPMVLSPSVRKARATLMAHAALGACPGLLPQLIEELDRAIDIDFAEAQQRGLARDALLERPLSLAVPCLGPTAVVSVTDSSDRLIELQRALASGDRSALAEQRRRLSMARRYNRAGDITFDYVFNEAWIVAAAGDTSAAVDAIRRSLDGLSLSAPTAFLEVPVIGGLVRSMALGAILARHMGDTATASQWSDAAVTLWSGADPELQPIVTTVRSLRGGTAPPGPQPGNGRGTQPSRLR